MKKKRQPTDLTRLRQQVDLVDRVVGHELSRFKAEIIALEHRVEAFQTRLDGFNESKFVKLSNRMDLLIEKFEALRMAAERVDIALSRVHDKSNQADARYVTTRYFHSCLQRLQRHDG